MEKARGFQKSICFCFIDYTKAFDCVDHNKLENSEKDGNTRPPYLPSEKPVGRSRRSRSRHETGSKLGKMYKGCILSSCLYAEYVMQTAKLDESQTGIQISQRNINLRHADDTTLTAESEKELKIHLMKVKEKSKEAGLKLKVPKAKITASGSIMLWQIIGGKVEAATDILFLGSKITVDGDCNHEMKRYLLLGRKAMTNLDSMLISRGITLLTKVYIIKAMVFSVVM